MGDKSELGVQVEFGEIKVLWVLSNNRMMGDQEWEKIWRVQQVLEL